MLVLIDTADLRRAAAQVGYDAASFDQTPWMTAIRNPAELNTVVLQSTDEFLLVIDKDYLRHDRSSSARSARRALRNVDGATSTRWD